MVIELGADFIPVVFLTTDTADSSSNDDVVVAGQENLSEDASETDGKEETGTEDTNNEENTEGEEAKTDTANADTQNADAANGDTTGTDETEGGNDGDTMPEEGTTGGSGTVGSGVVEGDAPEGEMVGGSMAVTGGKNAKDPLLSNPVAVIGISVGFFVLGGLLGFILAKKKIKKGIELYEDI